MSGYFKEESRRLAETAKAYGGDAELGFARSLSWGIKTFSDVDPAVA